MATVSQAAFDFLKSRSTGSRFSSNNVKVPTLTVNSGKSISGVSAVAKHVQRTAQDLSGLNLDQRMDVEQWIDYATTTVQTAVTESNKQLLKEVNNYLKDKTYFVAMRLTMADIVMFFNLYPLLAEWTFHEKEQYIHLSRWFHNIQQESQVRQSLELIPFLRTTVYDGARLH